MPRRQVSRRYGCCGSRGRRPASSMRYGWWGPGGWIPFWSPSQVARGVGYAAGRTMRKAGDLSDYIGSTISAAKLGLRVGGLSAFHGHRADLQRMKSALRDDREARLRAIDAEHEAKMQAIYDTTAVEEALRKQWEKQAATGRMMEEGVKKSKKVGEARGVLEITKQNLSKSLAPTDIRHSKTDPLYPVYLLEPQIMRKDDDGIDRPWKRGKALD